MCPMRYLGGRVRLRAATTRVARKATIGAGRALLASGTAGAVVTSNTRRLRAPSGAAELLREWSSAPTQTTAVSSSAATRAAVASLIDASRQAAPQRGCRNAHPQASGADDLRDSPESGDRGQIRRSRATRRDLQVGQHHAHRDEHGGDDPVAAERLV